jgi:hypothetical protein
LKSSRASSSHVPSKDRTKQSQHNIAAHCVIFRKELKWQNIKQLR